MMNEQKIKSFSYVVRPRNEPEPAVSGLLPTIPPKVAPGCGLRCGVTSGDRCPPIALNLARTPKSVEFAGVSKGSPGARLGRRRPSDVTEFECVSPELKSECCPCVLEELVPFPPLCGERAREKRDSSDPEPSEDEL